MRIIFNRRLIGRYIFIFGLFLMFFGSIFLFGWLEETSKISVLVSFLFVLAGVAGAALAIRLNRRSIYLFFAAFFLQIGLFLFLSAVNVLPLPFSKAWPMLSVFAGIALIPTGWFRFGKIQLKYIVLAAAFIVLGIIMLIFSFKVVPFSLIRFVVMWWPLLVVLAGLTLILIALGTKNTGDTQR